MPSADSRRAYSGGAPPRPGCGPRDADDLVGGRVTLGSRRPARPGQGGERCQVRRRRQRAVQGVDADMDRDGLAGSASSRRWRAGVLLAVRGDRVLQVDDDHVGAGGERLAHHLRAVAGDVQPGQSVGRSSEALGRLTARPPRAAPSISAAGQAEAVEDLVRVRAVRAARPADGAGRLGEPEEDVLHAEGARARGPATSVIVPRAWYCGSAITSRMSWIGATAASAFSKAAMTSARVVPGDPAADRRRRARRRARPGRRRSRTTARRSARAGRPAASRARRSTGPRWRRRPSVPSAVR